MTDEFNKRLDREVIDAFEKIEGERLTAAQEYMAHALIAVWSLDRKRVAEGGKPLHELTVAEIIDIAREFGAIEPRAP